MSESDHVSTSSDLQVADPQILAPEQQHQELNMSTFLREHGPQFNVTGKQSEFDVLRQITGITNKLKKFNFNYHFDEQSYSQYSKLQNVVRLELTTFRQWAADEVREMQRRDPDRYQLPLEGYYYELGQLQKDEYKPTDWYDPKKDLKRK